MHCGYDVQGSSVRSAGFLSPTLDAGQGGGGDDGDDELLEVPTDATFKPPSGQKYGSYTPMRKRVTFDPYGGQPGGAAQKYLAVEDVPSGDAEYVGKQSQTWEELYIQTLSFLYDTCALYDFNSQMCAMVLKMINKLPSFLDSYFGQTTANWLMINLETTALYNMFVKDVYLWQTWITAAEPYVVYLKSILPAPRRELSGQTHHEVWIHMSDAASSVLVNTDGTNNSLIQSIDGWAITSPTGSGKFYNVYFSFDGTQSPLMDSTHAWSLHFHLTVPPGAYNSSAHTNLKLIEITNVMSQSFSIRMETSTRELQIKQYGQGTSYVGFGRYLHTGVSAISLHYQPVEDIEPGAVAGSGAPGWMKWTLDGVDTLYGVDAFDQSSGDPYFVQIAGGQAEAPVVWHDIHLV